MIPLLILGAAVLAGVAAAYFILKNAKKDADCKFSDKPVGNTAQKCPLEDKEAISEAEAKAVFDEMASQKDIAFKYPADGCYARAHIMIKRMEAKGLNPQKVWTFASDPKDPLWVNTTNHPDGKVEWMYHVAPTLKVKDNNGKVQDMVMDPSLFNKPVTIGEWKNAQNDKPSVIQTKIGEPPKTNSGGSGYWPGPDPIEGIDSHAEDTMEEYKRLEGTRGY